MTNFKVTKKEKVQALEDMLFNSFSGITPSRKHVVSAATSFARAINENFKFVITEEDINDIVDILETRMDFSLNVKV